MVTAYRIAAHSEDVRRYYEESQLRPQAEFTDVDSGERIIVFLGGAELLERFESLLRHGHAWYKKTAV